MWPLGLCIIFALLIIWFTHLIHRWSNPRCNGALPPGSMGFPFIGETLQLLTPADSLDILPFFKKRIHMYGKVFRTSLFGKQVVVSADPEVNHFILQNEGELVRMWYLDAFEAIFQPDELVKDTGYMHKFIKSLILTHFGPEGLKDKLLPTLQHKARQTLRAWASQPSVEVKQAILSMISDVVLSELLSYDPENSLEDMRNLFAIFLRGLFSFPLNIPGTPFHKCLKDQKKILKVMKEAIKKRMRSSGGDEIIRHGDLLDVIIEGIKLNETGLTEDHIAYTMFGILVASTESFPSILTLAVKLVTDHPLVLQEVKEEHEAILKNRQHSNPELTWQEYKSMTFTQQVVNEVLRMAVGMGIFRKAIKDIHINGFTIPAGWVILVFHPGVNLDSDIFSEPLIFNPWRWKGESKVNAKSFTPFGGGIRVCAGAEFSKLLMTVFLHVLLTNYRWSVIKEGPVRRTPTLSFGDGFHIKLLEKME